METSNKISLDEAFAEYTTKELVDFHANLSAIFIGVKDWDKSDIMILSLMAFNALEHRPDASAYCIAFKEAMGVMAY